MNLKAIQKRLEKCKSATVDLSFANLRKNMALQDMAASLHSRSEELLTENKKDLQALGKSATSAFHDRLTLNEQRIEHMSESLKNVADLPDPVAEVVETIHRPNGLVIKKQRAPLGLIFMIFESRPNVALEAFSLGFKAGNGMILRGGKESRRTVRVLYDIISSSLKKHDFDPQLLWGIDDYDRSLTKALLKQNQYIDVVVPRGGEGLIRAVVKESTIPIIKNDRGLCHIYVDQNADPTMALDILVNAKTQRPGVCNAVETVLVHEALAQSFILDAYNEMIPHGVKWHACPKSLKILKGCKNVAKATEKNFSTEYLDLILNCKVVANMDDALEHIRAFGSRHSECIVTSDPQAAQKFQDAVDCAAIYWNASTRFTDGFEFGLGGEIGISTQKLHARGPVGLRELTSLRWVIHGQGQIRE